MKIYSLPRACFRPVSIFFLLATLIFLLFGLLDENILPKSFTSPTPYSVMPLYPSANRLIDLIHFKYLINSDICTKDSTVYVVVIVHSHPANRDRRDAMRRNVPYEDLVDLGIRRVFLLARAEWNDQELYKRTPQDTINEENTVHSDIVQGNFKEHYHNLTYKHVMGLQWSVKYCSQARYIIKMDDDIVVDLYQFRDKLRYRYESRTNLILGLLQVEAKPVRNKQSKWYVSKKEFSGDVYPNFVSGWAYAITSDAAKRIIAASSTLPYLWIDDMHITGTLAEATGVKREGLNKLYTLHAEHLHCCIHLPHYKEFVCDYIAGPSEGDVNLMEKVLSHSRYCYINTCRRRSLEDSVARSCINAPSPLEPSGQGKGEVIRLF